MAEADEPFLSLYRRFRPGRFEELRGQPHVVLGLRSAVRDGRVSHAYLFSGPRGTGKTSTARILARALNCADRANPPDGEPCGHCTSCTEIARGTSLDVHELDAASNNGVDAMRDLISHAALATPGRWKVYIVDEVHMLSTAASNALLKTLEEPPGHVIFVLATTDPQKVPPTIRSRTQHFEFRLLPTDTLAALVRDVNAAAGLELDEGALSSAVRRGRGSARDALSALDQVAASGSADEVRPEISEVVDALAAEDAGRALVASAELHEAGWGPQQLAVELVDELRQLFLAVAAPSLVGSEGDAVAAANETAQRLGLPRIVRAMEVLGRAQIDMRDAPDPRVVLEVALVRLNRPEIDDSAAAVLERLTRLERQVSDGVAAPVAHTPTPAAPPPAPEGPLESRPTIGALRRQQPAGGEPPDRDKIVQAWGDHILRGLPARAKVLYNAGRFTEATGDLATFALPNDAHRARCEEVRGIVEAALAAYFGETVRLNLVVDGSVPGRADPTPPASERASEPPTVVAPTPESEVTDGDDFEDDEPVGEVIDAAREVEAQVLENFPGAEEVEG